MPQNIHQNDVGVFDIKCIYDEFYDFMLYKGETSSSFPVIDASCIAADVNMAGLDSETERIWSDVVWSGSVNGGVVLKDIGMTGVDNGFYRYNKDDITNNEFADIYTTKTPFVIDAGDGRFFLTSVTGNTGNYNYPYEVEDDYVALKGGFFQGFYKLHGFDYQTLPNKIIGSEWDLVFKIRPRSDYKVQQSTLNALYPENKGIFFFMGTRAENKFWEYYRVSKDTLNDVTKEDIFNDNYLKDCGDGDYVYACDVRPDLSDYASTACTEDSLDYLWDNYLKKQGELKTEDITASDGTEFGSQDLKKIETDNKFIIFNRTATGLTVDTYEESASTHTIKYTEGNNLNLFPYMDRTKTGYTTDNIDELLSISGVGEYNIYGKSINNALAFRVQDDGSIGYRMMGCPDGGGNYEIKEEYSKPGLVKMDEWNDIVVKIKLSEPRENVCERGRVKMKLYFYVNGYLVFISKDLPEFHFRELDEIAEKQEGVPYNLSVGGGTQGLLEVIWPDYYQTTKFRLPLEKHFGGTFMGDIKRFRFITCPLSLSQLRELI